MSNERLSKQFRIVSAVFTVIIAVAAVSIVFGGDPLDMSQATTPNAVAHLLIILAAAIMCAAVAHLAIQRWLLASFVSGLAFTTLAQIIGYISLGYLDPFFIIALVVGALVGFAVATVVGIPFLIFRRRRTPNEVAEVQL